MSAVAPERAGAGPVDPWRTWDARVLEVREEIAAQGASRAVTTLALERDGLEYRPGQFLQIGLPGAGEVPISISSAPGLPGALFNTIRAAGQISAMLVRRRPGDVVTVRGPFGNGFPIESYQGLDALFVAGGIGLAPLRGLLWEMLLRRERYGRILLLHGARTPHDLLYPWQWPEWRAAGVEMQLATDIGGDPPPAEDGPPRVVGFITQLFPRLRLDPAKTVAFLCGPPAMIHIACGELSRTQGLPPRRLVATLERHMKCGIGKCGHCVVVDRYVCVDGPVVTYDELIAMNAIEPPW